VLKNNGFHNRHSPFSRPFSPASFFANGEQGWWYDPSNFATLFQDSAGTTPVTAMEQPVGLQLDLSKGLVLGPELVTNGDFSNGTTGWTASSVVATVSDGVLTLSGGTGTFSQAFTTIVGKVYKVTGNILQVGTVFTGIRKADDAGAATNVVTIASTVGAAQGIFTATATTTYLVLQQNFSATAGKFDNISVKELPGNHRFQTTSANRPVVSARVNLLVGTATLATQSVTTRATTYTLTFTGAGSITLTGTALGVYTAGTYSVTTTAGTLTATVLGTVTQADLRETNVGVGLPAYQAVVTSTNYDSTGFPTYIKPNGSNQFMVTNSINFTTTDKMTVWQGVRKLSNSTAIVEEFSNTTDSNSGSFHIATLSYTQFISKGTLPGAVISGVASAPVTFVVTGLGDISGDTATIRINGVQEARDTSNQGTGNYGNYPAYFYMRGGTTLPFNGNDYGSIARGAASTAAQITNGETYINSKTKAY
jgi:hypothetical protein